MRRNQARYRSAVASLRRGKIDPIGCHQPGSLSPQRSSRPDWSPNLLKGIGRIRRRSEAPPLSLSRITGAPALEHRFAAVARRPRNLLGCTLPTTLSASSVHTHRHGSDHTATCPLPSITHIRATVQLRGRQSDCTTTIWLRHYRRHRSPRHWTRLRLHLNKYDASMLTVDH